jgi:hypothetical protein
MWALAHLPFSGRFQMLTARSILTACAVAFGAGAAAAQSLAETSFPTAIGYSNDMFDKQEHVTNKIVRALKARKSGEITSGRLYLGGHVSGSIISEHTNTAGKFPILSRLPPTHTTGTSDTYRALNDLSVNATLTLPYVTAFVQGEYTEVAYAGQDRTKWRKAWVALGDLRAAPVYVAFGRNSVNFGNFSTYAPFTHSHSAHYFWAQSEDPHVEFGYVTDRTELSLSLIPNHRGLRTLSSPSHDGEFGNFAVNVAHRLPLSSGFEATVGAGYLRGTIYDSVIAHHPPGVGINRDWNGAWTVNTTLSGARFDLMAEFSRTDHIWPATGHRVSALNVQGRYRGTLWNKPATWSISASRGVQGPSGTEWERMDQVILGLEIDMTDHWRIGAEYLFNKGFVPLINPTLVGDRDVISHTVLIGTALTF